MKISDHITIVREDYLDDTLGVDDNDALVTETQLIRFAEDAQKQACRRMDLLWDETSSLCTITLVADQAQYPFSQKITKLESVRYDGAELEKKTESEMDLSWPAWRSVDSGIPLYYIVRGRTISLYPAPDAASATELNLGVYRLPITALKSKSQGYEVEEEAQEDFIYWMLYRVYNLRDEDLFDPDKAGAYKQMFDDSYGDEISMEMRIHQLESPKKLRHIALAKYTFTGDNSEDPDFSPTGW